MTDKSKTPPAKKTIQDPPEYAAANKLKGHENQAGYQQNGQSYQQNGQSAVAPASNDQHDGRVGTGNVSGDFLGGPQDVAEVPGSKESGPTGSGKAQGEGARNPQTGERYARNPQTGE
ncbi:hypothetical protein [Rhizobium sp. K102]|uniref:hypothetical protein n=1 Tax=Rhizobium sp. K102 TaxID=2918527 RepID=UPI001EFBB2FF|nr:hypothetical protein [Rhizobium sp. K102]ULR43640.1 hypothetical protein MHI61_21030 [Rhizobium sp. K102]